MLVLIMLSRSSLHLFMVFRPSHMEEQKSNSLTTVRRLDNQNYIHPEIGLSSWTE